MVWFLLALLGAFFDAVGFAFIKKFVKEVNRFVLASGVYAITGILLIIISIIYGFPILKQGLWIALFITGTINVITATLYYRAFQISDISLVLPMLAFTPVFLILTSPLITGESPSAVGMVGMLLIVAGSYILNFRKRKVGILEPLKSLFKNRGTLYMLIVALLWSVSANYDKLVVLNSDPILAGGLTFFYVGAVFAVISCFKAKNLIISYKTNLKRFILPAIATVIMAILINKAYILSIVPYVISLKRTAILWSVLFGYLFFKEKHIGERFIGAVIMFLGVLVITLLA